MLQKKLEALSIFDQEIVALVEDSTLENECNRLICVIVIPWTRVHMVCLICTPETQGLRAYISGKSRYNCYVP